MAHSVIQFQRYLYQLAGETWTDVLPCWVLWAGSGVAVTKWLEYLLQTDSLDIHFREFVALGLIGLECHIEDLEHVCKES